MRDFGILIPILGIMCGFVAIIGGVFIKPWLRLKEKQLQMQSHATAEKAAQYAAHTERLEQRVRVLERIVTDKGIDVAEEIDRLRDETSVN
jgi:ABC-type phosphate transport system auxiliary subunit